MITASELAGFIAAHAIWCVSDADGLIPMVAFTTADGQRKLERLVFDDAVTAVEHGRRRLEYDPCSATTACWQTTAGSLSRAASWTRSSLRCGPTGSRGPRR